MTNTGQTLNCVIVDDEPLPLKLLTDYVLKTPGLTLIAAVSNPLQLLEVMEQRSVQIVFLDIQMPELTGLQVAKLINGKCEIVITTAYPQYALEGYEFDVADYLLKPFSFDRFLVAVNKCKKRIMGIIQEKDTGQSHFFVKSGSRLLRILYSDVIYLEGMRDYVQIHSAHEKILTQQSLTSFEEQLPGVFVRIHRSYIVNAGKVSYIEGNTVSLGSTMLPVGEKYQGNVTRILK